MIAQQIDSKKEPLAVNAAVVSSPKFIRVVAPSNLPGHLVQVMSQVLVATQKKVLEKERIVG